MITSFFTSAIVMTLGVILGHMYNVPYLFHIAWFLFAVVIGIVAGILTGV